MLDLIPETNLREWLKYLREEFPTVPFKASTQVQKEHLVSYLFSAKCVYFCMKRWPLFVFVINSLEEL